MTTEISSLSVGLDLKNTGFSKRIDGAIDKVKGLATAVTAVSAGIAAFTFKNIESVDAINKLSDRTDISVEQLSLLETQLALSDIGAEQLGKGVERLQRTIGDAARGFKAPVEALAELGLKADDLIGLDITGQLGLVADRLLEIENPAKRASVGYGVLGRQFKVLAPFLKQGSRAMQEQSEQLTRLGLIMDKVSADQASEALDALTKLGAVATRFNRILAASFGPQITDAVEGFLTSLPQWLENLKVAFASTGAFVGALFAQIGALFDGVSGSDFLLSPAATIGKILSGNNLERAASIDPFEAANLAAIRVFEQGLVQRANPANFTSGTQPAGAVRGTAGSEGEIITLLKSIDGRLVDLKARAS